MSKCCTAKLTNPYEGKMHRHEGDRRGAAISGSERGRLAIDSPSRQGLLRSSRFLRGFVWFATQGQNRNSAGRTKPHCTVRCRPPTLTPRNKLNPRFPLSIVRWHQHINFSAAWMLHIFPYEPYEIDITEGFLDERRFTSRGLVDATLAVGH